MQKNHLYVLTVTAFSLLTGCGSEGGTAPEWVDTMWVQSVSFVVDRVGFTATTEGTSVYLAASGQNSNPVSFRQYSPAGELTRQTTPDVELVNKIVVPLNDHLIVQDALRTETSYGRPFQTEVSALTLNGETIWTRTITPQMAVEPGSDNIYYVSAMLSFKNYTDSQITLLLTGLDNDGKVRWQNSVSEEVADLNEWKIDWDSSGAPCYVRPLQENRFLVCLNNDGSESFRTNIPDTYNWPSLHVFENKIAITNVHGTSTSVSIYSKQGAFIQQCELNGMQGLKHIAETKDDRIHLFFFETVEPTFKKYIVSLDSSGNRVDHELDVSQWYYKGDREIPLRWELIGPRSENITTDEKGNLYFSHYVGGENSALGYHYQTIRHVIMKLDTQDTLTTVVEGNLYSYNYIKNGACSFRCEQLSGLKNLQGMKMLPDGELITLWGIGKSLAVPPPGLFSSLVVPLFSVLTIEKFKLE